MTKPTGWDRAEAQVNKGPMRAFLYLFGILLVCVVVVGAAGFALGIFGQGARVLEKTFDADNMIANYEWFKKRHEDIQALDAKVTGAKMAVSSFAEDAGDRANWHREDREENSRLNSILLGLRQQRNDLAAEYNARSRMVNRSIFKTGDTELPESISIEGN